MSNAFAALVVDQIDGRTTAKVELVDPVRLPDGEVLVDVAWSTLNYKDGLAITGAGKIIRSFPFIPGIDLAGSVASSSDPRFAAGQQVLLTGYGVGERHWGGLARKARVKADWLVPLPAGLTSRRAMAVGTAGFTAMLAVTALEQQGVRPGDGEVVVTGAAGGVGSIAVALLARAGFTVVASTGRLEHGSMLRRLGAAEVVDRAMLGQSSKAPLDSARWSGAIDSVGGDTLVNLLKGMRYHGAVAACGLAGSAALTGTVYPFILRGVRLIGIDSVNCPMPERLAAWTRIAKDLDPGLLDGITAEIGLAAVPEVAARFLEGKVAGRVVVDLAREAPGPTVPGG